MDRELIAKLMNEEALTPQEEAILDAKLVESSGVAPLLKQVSDEVPSMAWRSELNEKLQTVARPRATQNRISRWLVPATAIAAATILFSMFSPKQAATMPDAVAAKTPTIEAQLVSAHRDSVAILDVSSAGELTMDRNDGSLMEGDEWAPTDLSPL